MAVPCRKVKRREAHAVEGVRIGPRVQQILQHAGQTGLKNVQVGAGELCTRAPGAPRNPQPKPRFSRFETLEATMDESDRAKERPPSSRHSNAKPRQLTSRAAQKAAPPPTTPLSVAEDTSAAVLPMARSPPPATAPVPVIVPPSAPFLAELAAPFGLAPSSVTVWIRYSQDADDEGEDSEIGWVRT